MYVLCRRVSADISGNARVPVLQLIYYTSGTLKIYPNLLLTTLPIYIAKDSHYIGRLQVEKHVNPYVQGKNVTYFVVHDVNRYMMKRSSSLSLYSLDSDFSSSYIGKSQLKNTHISLNMKPSWLT